MASSQYLSQFEQMSSPEFMPVIIPPIHFPAPLELPSAENGNELLIASTETNSQSDVDTPMADTPPAESTTPHSQARTNGEMNGTTELPQVAPLVPELSDGLPASVSAGIDAEAAVQQAQESEIEPSPPDPPAEPSKLDVPEWVLWEDDLSAPDEEELKEIEGTDADLSALDVPNIEKRVFQDVDDPEQRPVKKIRLSWVIKGVRGTKEKPNRARTITSPCALIDGHYWQIKFYPRGNKSSALSAYIKCMKRLPKPDAEVPESTFCYYEGEPSAHMGDGAEPKHVFNIRATSTKVEDKAMATGSIMESNLIKDNEHDFYINTANPTNSQDNTAEVQTIDEAGSTQAQEFRISAQLGMVIYNPAEPRTGTYMSSEHQFNHNNDDWGWTNFVGPWNEVHIRQRGQRQPLLRNDTIAIDAYIRIFNDPSEALWWHPSQEHEPLWPSVKLAGYFPMGTPPLYHSPAVAGMTAWLLLVPFRKALESVDSGKWRTNSQVKPCPIISKLQIILHLMRNLQREEYVDLYPVFCTMREFGETHCDPISFWEAFRRSIDLELEGENEARSQINQIFDTTDGKWTTPVLPVKGIRDIQEGVNAVFGSSSPGAMWPNFLPLALQREVFDKVTREWKMQHDRVILNEEIEIPQVGSDGGICKYTLYGFMVHVAERSSGRFYSVLRPNGPGTKWLAFEDGNGNKIFSYTRRRIQDFEGLEGDELKTFKSTRQTACLAMYIKNSCLKDYLTGTLDEYILPKWLMPFVNSEDVPAHGKDNATISDDENLAVEVYHDEGVFGREGLLDMFNLRQQSKAGSNFRSLSLPSKTTLRDLRRRLAGDMNIENVEEIKLFVLNYGDVGQYTSAQWECVDLDRSICDLHKPVTPICLWSSLLKNEDEIKQFGDSEPSENIQNSNNLVISATCMTDITDDGGAVGVDGVTTEPTQADQVDGENFDPQIDVAGPDATMFSVHQAVTADIAMSDIEQDHTDTGNVSTGEHTTTILAMTGSTSTGDAEESTTPHDSLRPAAVEHGHLIDAMLLEETPAMGSEYVEMVTIDDVIANGFDTPMLANALELSEAEARLITSFTGENATSVPPAAGGNEELVQQADAVAETDVVSNRTTGPIPYFYGFIQFFDVNKQDFVVHSTFFAKRGDRVVEVMRKCMGYDPEKCFHVWHRETTLDGETVPKEASFEDIRFANGVDIIVGDVLSDSQIQALHNQGKFSCPFALSRYLRTVERQHPIKALTTIKAVEIADFGTEYYKGPLVNGQPHGDNCIQITANGTFYQGPLVCGTKCGTSGKMIYQNGDIYEGEWQDDERHGQGTFIEKRTGNKYVGGFMNGKRWGRGTTFWEVADEEADMCQICYGEEIDALFFDCGHVCSCMECAKQCEVCPICRKSIRQVVKMFWA